MEETCSSWRHVHQMLVHCLRLIMNIQQTATGKNTTDATNLGGKSHMIKGLLQSEVPAKSCIILCHTKKSILFKVLYFCCLVFPSVVKESDKPILFHTHPSCFPFSGIGTYKKKKAITHKQTRKKKQKDSKFQTYIHFSSQIYILHAETEKVTS